MTYALREARRTALGSPPAQIAAHASRTAPDAQRALDSGPRPGPRPGWRCNNRVSLAPAPLASEFAPDGRRIWPGGSKYAFACPLRSAGTSSPDRQTRRHPGHSPEYQVFMEQLRAVRKDLRQVHQRLDRLEELAAPDAREEP